ncbi:MAG: YjjG family noncanonical pyrimidine nucleotidase [Bacteroidota bacterium]
MFKGKITDIFFDLDHTLWDFERNSALTFQLIFQEQGLKVNTAHFLEYYVPINFRFWKLYREEKVSKEELRYQRLKQSFDSMGLRVNDTIINVLSDSYIAHLSNFKHVLPGTFEILDYLKGTYGLHIITNGFSEIQEKKMKNANIRHYFNVVVNSEMAGVKKPNPKIFLMALEKASVQPQNALMIGDNLEADILGAQKVGLHALHLNSNREQHHEFSKIIHYLHEIKNFL